MQAEEQSGSGETSKDQLSSCGMARMKRGGRNANMQFRHEEIELCGAERDQRRGTANQEGLNTWGKRSSVEKLNEARKRQGEPEAEEGMEDEAPNSEVNLSGRARRQGGWWKPGVVETKLNTVKHDGMGALRV